MNRTHCVSVRLSPDELAQLDTQRARTRRGTYLRQCWLTQAPAPVPEINRATWQQLARVGGNLNQLAKAIATGDAPDLPAIRNELAAFRAALLSQQ